MAATVGVVAAISTGVLLKRSKSMRHTSANMIVQPVPAPVSADTIQACEFLKESQGLARRGNTGEAINLGEKALALCKHDDKTKAAICGHLAELYLDAGDEEKANSLFSEEFSLKCGSGPSVRPVRPRSEASERERDEVASLYEKFREMNFVKNSNATITAGLEVLRRSEKAFGRDHMQFPVAICTDLAEIFKDTGDYTNAVAFAQRVLRSYEQAYGAEHLEVVYRCGFLASIHEKMSQYSKAEPYRQRALSICEKSLSPDNPNTVRACRALAELYERMGEFPKAEQVRRRMLKDVGRFESLLRESRDLGRKGRTKEAIETATKALTLCGMALGHNHPDKAAIHVHLAMLYLEAKDYRKAGECLRDEYLCHRDYLATTRPRAAVSEKASEEVWALMEKSEDHGDLPAALRSLALSEKTFGPDDVPITARICRNLAEMYSEKGDHPQAEAYGRRALEITEKVLGPNHIQTAERLGDLAYLHLSMGAFAKAEPLCQRQLQIVEQSVSPQNPAIADVCAQLGRFYRTIGDLAKAETYFVREYDIRRKTADPTDRDIANTLKYLYSGGKDSSRAEALARRVPSLREEAPAVARSEDPARLRELAMEFERRKEYAKAEPLLLRALELTEKSEAPNAGSTAECLERLAGHYEDRGLYEKAEPLYLRALKIRETAPRPYLPYVGSSLVRLARCYEKKGDSAMAEAQRKRAIEIAMDCGSPDILEQLAGSYVRQGDCARAEPLYLRALAVQEKLGRPADAHTIYDYYGPLAELYKKMADETKAEALFQKVLSFTSGTNDLRTLQICGAMAGIYENMGDRVRAEPFRRRRLSIREAMDGPDHPACEEDREDLIEAYCEMDDAVRATPHLKRAVEFYQKLEASGSLTREFRDNASELSYMALDLKRPDEAGKLAALVAQADERALNNILSFTSEQQRSAFQERTDPYSLLANIGRAPALAQTLLRCKSIVLDSLLEDRLAAEASRNPAHQEALAKLNAAKQKLMQLVLKDTDDPGPRADRQRAAQQQALGRQVEELEAALARNVAGFGQSRRALRVTVTEVQAALAPGQALVEWVYYERYTGHGGTESPCLGAVVIGREGEPRWIALEESDDDDGIEYCMDLCRQLVRNPKAKEDEQAAALHSLYNELWAPVEKLLPPGTSTVILCPDGDLNFLSFATLLTPDNRFLCEKYSFRYVASGRDLVREFQAKPRTVMDIFANPDFQAASAVPAAGGRDSVMDGSLAMRAVDRRDLSALSLPPLPGTQREGEALAAQLRQAGMTAELFKGGQATETRLRQIAAPSILHLATHGFFLPDSEEAGLTTAMVRQRGMSVVAAGTNPPAVVTTALPAKAAAPKNPMHRSGLAFAGAQTTFSSWARGVVPATDSDGIVTAEEVGGLNLNGTWLVVLSACETGTGVARAGEGVLGLRRGFIQAGTRNLLMTLWPVADEETVRIMTDFYAAAQSTGQAPKALADVQRDWLVKLRREKGLWFAVNRAGPFIMSFQGTAN